MGVHRMTMKKINLKSHHFSLSTIKNSYKFHFASCVKSFIENVFLNLHIKIHRRNLTNLKKKLVKKKVRILFFVLVSENGIKKQYQVIRLSKSKNFQATIKYSIPYEKSWKDLSNGKLFGNVTWNYYHQKLKKTLKHCIGHHFFCCFFIDLYRSLSHYLTFLSARIRYFLDLSWFSTFLVFSSFSFTFRTLFLLLIPGYTFNFFSKIYVSKQKLVV